MASVTVRQVLPVLTLRSLVSVVSRNRNVILVFNERRIRERPKEFALGQRRQGGLQALSRSYFGQLIPKDSSSEFFGFYNILGKFSAILGPMIVGLVTQWTGKSTIGAASLSVLFTIGLVIFLLLPRLGSGVDD